MAVNKSIPFLGPAFRGGGPRDDGGVSSSDGTPLLLNLLTGDPVRLLVRTLFLLSSVRYGDDLSMDLRGTETEPLDGEDVRTSEKRVRLTDDGVTASRGSLRRGVRGDAMVCVD